MNPIEQQEILREMGLKFLEFAPEQWEKMVYKYTLVFRSGTSSLSATYSDESSEVIDAPLSALEQGKKLRYGMYMEGKGTWFSMRYTITQPASYSVDFNYDKAPDVTFPPSPEDYAADLRKFPRDPEHIPDWLQEELRKARQG
ncbi:hypothetical protein [Nocardiopsis synnemataformans]|uniref:hypothetical protein n=1 Tax=Nocardiopsis synnemataformans TaxID=61305 RepID=UPI003EBEB724